MITNCKCCGQPLPEEKISIPIPVLPHESMWGTYALTNMFGKVCGYVKEYRVEQTGGDFVARTYYWGLVGV
jgi:hypothetical protein